MTSRRRSRRCSRGRVKGGSRCKRKPGPKRSRRRSRSRSRCRRVKSGPRKGRCYKKSRRHSRRRRRRSRSRSRCRRVKSGPRKGRCYKKSRRHSRRRRMVRYNMDNDGRLAENMAADLKYLDPSREEQQSGNTQAAADKIARERGPGGWYKQLAGGEWQDCAWDPAFQVKNP